MSSSDPKAADTAGVYSLLSKAESAGLDSGKGHFLKLLDSELKAAGVAIPAADRAKWIVSPDLGTLIDLWKSAVDDSTFEGPALARDILALHGLIPGGPRIYTKEIVKDLMDPGEAYAMPVSDREGQHLATIVHVGPKAKESDVRDLARSLIADPTGRTEFA